MHVMSLLGLVAGFTLAIYGNALRHPEMDQFFRKAPPQSRQEAEKMRRDHERKGRYLLIIGAGIFVISIVLAIASVR